MIYKEKIQSSDPRLARHIYHDSRSKDFMFDVSGLEIIDIEHKRLIPVLDQGQIGSCTGNAGIGGINTSPFILNTKIYTPDEEGALKLYSDATKLDEFDWIYPPTDSGSSGLAIAKALYNAGLISSYQHTFTLESALKALSKYTIITGINWYSEMYTPDSDGRVHPKGVIKGGHEIEGYKVDTKNGRIWFYNSWNTNWGINGTFYLTWADFATLLSQGGDVIVLIPPTEVVAPTTWKYFKSSEYTNAERTHTVAELKVAFVNMLDIARGISGVAYKLTSGFRTVVENTKVGGVSNSSHIKGLGGDIACTTATRQAILRGLLTCGIPVFIEDCPNHIHVDIDSSIHTLGGGIISQNG
jgi:hypothetical protein